MSFNNGPTIVTNGLVLALDAGDRNSYPGSGTTWRDLSGNNNNGTLTNGPTFNSANLGSIVFDGTNDYVDCGSFQVGNPSTITVSCWIKPNINTGRNDFVTKWDTGTGSPNTRTFNLLHGVTNGKFGFYISTDGGNVFTSGPSTTTIIAGNWYYTVGTYNGSSINLYINGLLENSSAQTGNLYWTPTRSLSIGANPGDIPGRYTNSNISAVQIYNRALSAAEILQNYNATKTRFGL